MSEWLPYILGFGALFALIIVFHLIGFAAFFAAWNYLFIPFLGVPAAPWYAVYGVYLLLCGALNAIGNIGRREVKS